ncbi:phage portal protein [Acrocarpospora sp. B8E8]|uniref:phage portal protein n=1 Tax=Acrocarpospora sp. B8E8 TaxID=3153572 RepID=UPI00325C9F73
MPLPDGGTPWPPPNLTPVLDKITEWATWYGGDPHHLAVYYGGETDGAFDSVSRARLNRPSQYRGGAQGALARWWWGQPVPVGERRTKVHVPLAGDIASISADLLFSEPPTFTVDDPATQAALDEFVDEGLQATLLEGAELCSALGGVYLRNCWDADIRDRPWIDVVHADAAVPEWRWGKLQAATFWRVLHEDDHIVVRHLERHEKGAIFHGVYEGTADKLGHLIPLTEYAETAALADVVIDGNRVETGIDMLTCGYVPNVRPNRLWRNLPAAANLGRSDYAGSEGLMDSLDETYSSLMRDVRIGKGRLVVPDSYLQNLGPGQGALFQDREVYQSFQGLPKEGLDIQKFQFDIRVEQHLATSQDLVVQIVRSSGYSAQSFGLTGEVAMTATEAKAKERRSFITRDKKINYWLPELADRVEAHLHLAAAIFGAEIAPQRPKITFGDTVSEDTKSLAETAELLFRAQAASTRERVRLVHPEWDDVAIDKEVEAIKEENEEPPLVGDPFAIQPGPPALEPPAGDEEPPDDGPPEE